jgi:hypothetical protein
MFWIALALAGAPPVTPPDPGSPQPMTLEVRRDPITDHLRATATLRADGERLELGCRTERPGRVEIAYRSRRWIARGNFLTGMEPITYRFDEQRPVRRLWRVRDRSASFDEPDRVVAFLRDLVRARRLALRASDIEGHRFDALFALGETAPAIAGLLATCGAPRLDADAVGAR